MVTMTDGTRVTEYEAATALTLEARRRGVSYGKVAASTNRWEQEEIVRRYLKKKAVLDEVRRKRRKKA